MWNVDVTFASLAVLCFQNPLWEVQQLQKPTIPLASHLFVPVKMFKHFYAKELCSDLISAVIKSTLVFIVFFFRKSSTILFREEGRKGVKKGCYD